MASAFITYYSVTVLFATHLQVDLQDVAGGNRRGRRRRQPRHLPGQRGLGLGGGQIRAAGRDDHPGDDRDPARAGLSAEHAISR